MTELVIKELALKALKKIGDNWSMDEFGNSILALFKNHVQSRYPGSQHWNPDKISLKQEEQNEKTYSGSLKLNVDIPGASRAYHDIDIYPKNGNWLAIPLHPFLVGMSARTQPGLFRPFKKGSSGRPELANVLAQKTEGGALVFMYALSKHVHQNQDSSLLPQEPDIIQCFIDDYVKQGNSIE